MQSDSSLIRLSRPAGPLHGNIALEGSKSITNRALIALKLAGVDPADRLVNAAKSKDSETLARLLAQTDGPYDAGDAGTTFRFMTALLALQPGKQVLTGSSRMLERPVGPLVEALRMLGAEIRFLGNSGYPPLEIGEFKQRTRRVQVAAHVSSQFLSALLLIGPCLPDGLELMPEGPLVSRPYVDMTLRLMQYFGAQADWHGDRIVVSPGAYVPRVLQVEADWSAASYWYAMAAFAPEADLRLQGLQSDSWQGDSVLAGMMERLGVRTEYEDVGVRLLREHGAVRPFFEHNFVECPDIAQTLSVICAGLGVNGLFSGLETLAIKETDRIGALKTELAKTGVVFSRLPARFSKKTSAEIYYSLGGKADLSAVPQFATYGDHRMAMSFATLAMLGPVVIENPAVVSKSYPTFWQHLAQTGFVIES
jgi:3-phosphoshikimate 1-carboxyvinyltransferase